MSGTRRSLVAVAALLLCSATAPARAATSTTRVVLPNGVTVVVRETRASPTVGVSLMARVAMPSDSAVVPGTTNFLQRVLLRGTDLRDAIAIAEAVEEIGGRLDGAGDVEHAELQGVALSRHWRTLLQLIAEVALRPSLSPSEIETERRIILSQLDARLDSPFSHAYDALLRELFGDHPYGHPALGTRAAIEHIDRATLQSHHRRLYTGGRLVLAISGDVRTSEAVSVARRLFRGVPASADGHARESAVVVSGSGRRVLERAAQQAHVLVGYSAPPVTSRDYAAVKVVSALLGGGMAGRLFVELRDKRGLAYSVGANNPSRREAGLFVVHIATTAENGRVAEAGLLQEIERLHVEPVSAEALNRAKAYLAGSLALDRRTNARQAWYLAFFEVLGGGADFFERYLRDVEAVTAEDVKRVSTHYLTRPVTIVLRPLP